MTSYQESQAQLARKQDGESEDIHIDVPKELPEVNPEVFRDVEPMLFRGFLHLPAEINDVSFVFKSLNHHEYNWVSLLAPLDGTHKSLKRFYSTFLAYGVFMLDGVNVLPERDKWIPDIVEAFEAMSDDVLGKVVRSLSEINRRANKAVILVEAFAMEFTSRHQWAQFHNLDLTSTPVTGISGTSTLGLNWAQRTWRSLNYYEDLKTEAEAEWENAKFIASAMAGKGMNRVHSQDKRRREQERESRLERRDKILRFALLGEPMDQSGDKKVPMMVARTVAELAQQLERDLKGEKDWHDKVIEQYERKAQEERQRQVETIQEMQQSYEAEYGTANVIGSTDMQGIKPSELQFQLDRKRQLTAQRMASRIDPSFLDPKSAQFIEKWSSVNKDPVPLAPVSPTYKR